MLELTPPPPFQRDGPNLYMTLHCHKVDDSTKVGDATQPVHVPAMWQIAPGDADDIRVCCSHPWQSGCLVFANGEAYGTTNASSGYRGIPSSPQKTLIFPHARK
jgi:hypothetical protein